MTWATRRTKPYTAAGIRRLQCLRCGEPADVQWQICADHRYYRPLCLDCDVRLNNLVLMWMGHPDAGSLIGEYVERMIP